MKILFRDYGRSVWCDRSLGLLTCGCSEASNWQPGPPDMIS